MTPNQLEANADRLYGFILGYVKEEARSPQYREMTRALGISNTTLRASLRLLVEQGRAIHRLGRKRQVWPRADRKGGAA